MKVNVVIALVAVAALSAGAVAAQTTTEVRQGKVLHVSGNQLLVELGDGSTKLFDVPADFRFDVDGRSLTVNQLKPGSNLPLLGLAGLMILSLGLGISVLRRF